MQKAAPKADEANNPDLEALLELNRNYVRSALESDVNWYAENLSEDFYITAPDGALLNREAFLKRIANPYPGTHAEAVDVMVRILGNVAIIHSGYRDTRLTGEPSYGRYTDIYERRNGRWLCVAAHFMRFSVPAKDGTIVLQTTFEVGGIGIAQRCVTRACLARSSTTSARSACVAGRPQAAFAVPVTITSKRYFAASRGAQYK